MSDLDVDVAENRLAEALVTVARILELADSPDIRHLEIKFVFTDKGEKGNLLAHVEYDDIDEEYVIRVTSVDLEDRDV